MKSLAVWTIKGGVGKTSAAVNLAHAAATDGLRTLLWDLDPQGAASFYLRIPPGMEGAVESITRKRTALADLVLPTEFDNLTTAQDMHWTLNRSYADEATLVSSGTIKSESTMYDITVSGDSYQVVSVGSCVAPSGAAPPPPVPPLPVVMPTSSFAWHGGVTAWRFGADTTGNDEIVVLGREQGKADWVAATDAGASSSRRVHFIDLDSLSVANLTALLGAIDTNGCLLYTSDAADE